MGNGSSAIRGSGRLGDLFSILLAGLRLLQYQLKVAQHPMVMVEVVGAKELACNTVALLHTAAPQSRAGGAVGFLSWKRCATVVTVGADAVVASCDASGT